MAVAEDVVAILNKPLRVFVFGGSNSDTVDTL